MISSVSSTSFLRQSATSLTNAGTGASFAQTLAAAAPSGTKVTISDEAKAKSVAQIEDFDFHYSANHTQEEYKLYLAEGARNVSKQQGLAEGQYDFTRMSPKQAMIVMNDAIVNKGTSLDDMPVFSGFSSDNMSWEGNKPVYSNEKMNAFSHVLSQKITKNGGPFGVSKETLTWMMSVQNGFLSTEINEAVFNATGIDHNGKL